MRALFPLLLAFTICTNLAFAEIEELTVTWNAALCADSCAASLDKQFMALPGAAEVLVDQAQGSARIRWKPRAAFSFQPIDLAMRAVGPRVKEAHIKVRGTISHDKTNIYLDSLGDNTRFILISPPATSSTEYVIKSNLQNRTLAPNIRDNFLNAEKKLEIVEVQGTLYEPVRTPTLYISIDRAESINLGGQNQTASQPQVQQ